MDPETLTAHGPRNPDRTSRLPNNCTPESAPRSVGARPFRCGP